MQLLTNFFKAKDDVYTYHGTDVLVQTSWELPIVVRDILWYTYIEII